MESIINSHKKCYLSKNCLLQTLKSCIETYFKVTTLNVSTVVSMFAYKNKEELIILIPLCSSLYLQSTWSLKPGGRRATTSCATRSGCGPVGSTSSLSATLAGPRKNPTRGPPCTVWCCTNSPSISGTTPRATTKTTLSVRLSCINKVEYFGTECCEHGQGFRKRINNESGASLVVYLLHRAFLAARGKMSQKRGTCQSLFAVQAHIQQFSFCRRALKQLQMFHSRACRWEGVFAIQRSWPDDSNG